jgi:hypothetical protein
MAPPKITATSPASQTMDVAHGGSTHAGSVTARSPRQLPGGLESTRTSRATLPLRRQADPTTPGTPTERSPTIFRSETGHHLVPPGRRPPLGVQAGPSSTADAFPHTRTVDIGSGRSIEAPLTQEAGEAAVQRLFPHRPSPRGANRTANIRALPGNELEDGLRHVFGSLVNAANVHEVQATLEQARSTLQAHGYTTKEALCSLLDSVQARDYIATYFHGVLAGTGFAVAGAVFDTAPGAEFIGAAGKALPQDLAGPLKAFISFLPAALILSVGDVIGGKPTNAVMGNEGTGYYRKPPETQLPSWLWHSAQPHRTEWGMEVGAGAVLGYGVVRNLMRMGVSLAAAHLNFDPHKADTAIDTAGGPLIASPVMRLFLNSINEYKGRSGHAHFLGREDLGGQLEKLQHAQQNMAAASAELTKLGTQLITEGFMSQTFKDVTYSRTALASHGVLMPGFAAYVATVEAMKLKNIAPDIIIATRFLFLLNVVYFTWGFGQAFVNAPHGKDEFRPDLPKAAFEDVEQSVGHAAGRSHSQSPTTGGGAPGLSGMAPRPSGSDNESLEVGRGGLSSLAGGQVRRPETRPRTQGSHTPDPSTPAQSTLSTSALRRQQSSTAPGSASAVGQMDVDFSQIDADLATWVSQTLRDLGNGDDAAGIPLPESSDEVSNESGPAGIPLPESDDEVSNEPGPAGIPLPESDDEVGDEVDPAAIALPDSVAASEEDEDSDRAATQGAS